MLFGGRLLQRAKKCHRLKRKAKHLTCTTLERVVHPCTSSRICAIDVLRSRICTKRESLHRRTKVAVQHREVGRKVPGTTHAACLPNAHVGAIERERETGGAVDVVERKACGSQHHHAPPRIRACGEAHVRGNRVRAAVRRQLDCKSRNCGWSEQHQCSSAAWYIAAPVRRRVRRMRGVRGIALQRVERCMVSDRVARWPRVEVGRRVRREREVRVHNFATSRCCYRRASSIHASSELERRQRSVTNGDVRRNEQNAVPRCRGIALHRGDGVSSNHRAERVSARAEDDARSRCEHVSAR